MMVMQQMRENTKWIMLITALAFVALMVFEWGMDASGGSASQFTGGEIGSVNGVAVTANEYSQVQRNLFQQRQQASEAPISSAESDRIDDQAWEQIVMDRLIQQELRRREIRVTDEEILAAAQYSPPPEFLNYEGFQTDGQFDRSKYLQFLSQASSDPQLMTDLENYYRRIIPRSKLFQQIGAGIVVTDGELWQMFRERNETARVRFVALDPSRMVADEEVTVTDRQIAEYYNENRDDFQRPARAEVRLVSVDTRPTAADTTASLERAREIRQEILDGADFAEIAATESDDEVSAAQGGDLGTIRRGQTVPEFEEAVWGARLGQLTEPVQSEFGYHIIRVDRRTDEEADVHHILVPIERTLESENRMLDRVDSLETLVERMSLESAADSLDMNVRTAELNPLLTNMPGVGDIGEGLDWAFEDEPLAGDVSEIFENESHFYVMELVEREEARPLTLEEATPTIRTILLNERKRERTEEIGRNLVDRLEAGASLADAAAEMNLVLREAGPFTRLDFVPGLGAANAAVGAAFGLAVGETSGLVSTESGFFVINVVERTPADREAWEAQKQSQRQQVLSSLQNQRINQFLDALRQEAEVVDNRRQALRPADSDQGMPQGGLGF